VRTGPPTKAAKAKAPAAKGGQRAGTGARSGKPAEVAKARAVTRAEAAKKAATRESSRSTQLRAVARAKPASPDGRGTARKPAAPPKPTRGPYADDEKFLQDQRRLLLGERLVYQSQAEDLRAEAESLALEHEPGDVQFDEESGEGGTVAVDRERDLTLSAQAVATIEEIDVSIAGINAKTYGACENCGRPIPKARLKALPYARLCVACKSGGLHRR
jgi:DnaK suppressor protein